MREPAHELLRRVRAGVVPVSDPLVFTRRRLLRIAATAAVAWKTSPWRLAPAVASAQTTPPGIPEPLVVVPTLEAFADTLIPGAKRSPADRAIAGAASGAGAVQAGAIDLMFLPAAGIAPVLPGHVAVLSARAAAFAASRLIALDPTVPPLVALSFEQRSALLLEVLDGASADFLLWYALAGLAFLAYHTAGHLPTADAVRDGHPGLAAIGFPAPDADGLWRFAAASYRRPLARRARHRRGSPP